jgi:hypothetical protein
MFINGYGMDGEGLVFSMTQSFLMVFPSDSSTRRTSPYRASRQVCVYTVSKHWPHS